MLGLELVPDLESWMCNGDPVLETHLQKMRAAGFLIYEVITNVND